MERQPLRIALLGGFHVQIGDHAIPAEAWRRRKARDLVKLLALARGYSLHREQVMDLLWPDADPQAALNSLHQTLYLARRVLEPGGPPTARYLLLQDEIVTLGPPERVWIDVAAFEAAAAHARHRQDPAAYRAALELYTGELLPEDRYEEWASARREALQQAYMALLRDLARLAEARTDYPLAIDALQQALAADRADEEVHRELMRLYALRGARQQAVRQYGALREALRRTLDLEPSPESQQLYEDILAGRLGTREPPRPRAGTPGEAPAGPPAPQHNLPIPLTSFIGREREIAEVQHLLTTTRLLTIAGPGGCGKTRLAIEAATATLRAYRDGVWLVELAALADPALVPQATATALGVREAPGQPLGETLAATLRPRQLLLLLDNCEHLIAACAQLAEGLLRACPHLRILATSREPLHVPGEVIWLAPALALPDPRQLPPLAGLLRYEAIQLLVERARAVVPAFQVTDQQAAALAQICTRLDGMPLAIELAAARVNTLTLEQLASRLDDAFRLLSGGSRTALSRQQTLRATLDWSYDLLAERERTLLRRLAVFAGGWTLEAAEAVCAGAGLDADDILGLLSNLVDKSLVVAEQQGAMARYRLLETVRQYSLDRLRATDEEMAVRTRHLDWHLALARRADPHLRGPQQAQWLSALQHERDNLRAALEWSLGDARQAPAHGSRPGEPQGAERAPASRVQPTTGSDRWITGLQLACALTWFWYLDGGLGEGGAWFERALARTSETERTWARAMALYGAGFIALHQHQGDLAGARRRLETSRALLQDVGAPHEHAMALFVLSVVAVNQGDDDAALSYLEESRQLFRSMGDQQHDALSLMHIGDVALRRGDWAAARASYEQALAIQQELGGMWGVAQLLNNLGEVARCEGDYGRAAGFYQESLVSFRALGSSGDIARSIHNLGRVAHAQHDEQRARACFTESLRLFQERGNTRGIIECLAGLAGVAGAQGRSEQAARLLGATAAHFEVIGAAMWPADRIDVQRSEAAIRAALGDDAFAAAWQAGRTLSLEQAIAEALSSAT